MSGCPTSISPIWPAYGTGHAAIRPIAPQTNTISAVYSSPRPHARDRRRDFDAESRARGPRRSSLMLTADERVIEAGNEFRGKRIGHGEGALWKNGIGTGHQPAQAELGRILSAHCAAHDDFRTREGRPTPRRTDCRSATNRRLVIAIIRRPATPEHWMFLRHIMPPP